MKLNAARRGAAVSVLVCVAIVFFFVGSGFSRTFRGVAQNQEPTVRTWQVSASRYKFDPPQIEVFQDDLVKIELTAGDIPHSLTIDAYRIAKRANPGHPVTF